MVHARIHPKTKSAMQSGKAQRFTWILECEPESPRSREAVMGWVASEDTQSQVKLIFGTQEEAEAFAQSRGWTYTVESLSLPKLAPKSYGDNFRFNRPRDETS